MVLKNGEKNQYLLFFSNRKTNYFTYLIQLMDRIINILHPAPMTNWQYRQMMQSRPVPTFAPCTVAAPPIEDNGSSLKAAYVQQVQLNARMIAPTIMPHRA